MILVAFSYFLLGLVVGIPLGIFAAVRVLGWIGKAAELRNARKKKGATA